VIDDQVPGEAADKSGETIGIPDVAAADFLERNPECFLAQVVDGGAVAAGAADDHADAACIPRDEFRLRGAIAVDDPLNHRSAHRSGRLLVGV
jgi:hypothetical protein